MTTQETREMLELAAKAAGYHSAKYQDMTGWGEARYGYDHAMWVSEIEDYWNPLVSDSNALRLAFYLKMDIVFDNGLVNVFCVMESPAGNFGASEIQGDDTAALRLAITRCAAEIGGMMP